MSGNRSTAIGVLSAALATAVIVACSGSTSPSLSADPRCGGIAHVPGWNIAMAVHLADSRTVDTFVVRLHQDLEPSALSGAVTDPVINDTANAYREWRTGVPGGAFAEHDTVINTSTPDTVSATSFAYTSGSEMYLSVDLKACTATIGGLFFARDSVVDVGTNPQAEVDTVELGYALFTSIPVDSATVVNGLVNSGTKVYTIATGITDFSHVPEYLAGGLSGIFTLNGGSQVLDSATVGYIVTAATAPAAGAPSLDRAGSAPARGRLGAVFAAPWRTGALP